MPLRNGTRFGSRGCEAPTGNGRGHAVAEDTRIKGCPNDLLSHATIERDDPKVLSRAGDEVNGSERVASEGEGGDVEIVAAGVSMGGDECAAVRGGGEVEFVEGFEGAAGAEGEDGDERVNGLARKAVLVGGGEGAGGDEECAAFEGVDVVGARGGQDREGRDGEVAGETLAGRSAAGDGPRAGEAGEEGRGGRVWSGGDGGEGGDGGW